MRVLPTDCFSLQEIFRRSIDINHFKTDSDYSRCFDSPLGCDLIGDWIVMLEGAEPCSLSRSIFMAVASRTRTLRSPSPVCLAR